jgi:hypothetical protein
LNVIRLACSPHEHYVAIKPVKKRGRHLAWHATVIDGKHHEEALVDADTIVRRGGDE